MIEDSECTHPINLDSLCGVCGKDLQYISQNKKEIKNYHPLFHSTDSLKINDAVFRDLYTERMSKLLNEKKLILLVDLDQTILCTVSETGQILNKPISQNDDKNSPDKNSLDKNTIENFDSLDKNTIKNFDSPDKNTIENFDSLDKNTIENFDSLDKNTIKNFDSLDKNTIKNFDSSKTFESPENQSKEKENKIHYTIDGQHFITYLRSGLKDFLFKLSLLFECHIYTAGTKSYTDALFKKIPYFKEVFSDRIITRETGHSDNQEIKNTTEDENLEDLGVFLPSQSQFQNSNILLKKSLSRLFGPFSHHVLIIDDRADIWAYIDNLIMIRPYYYKNDCNSDEKTLDCVYEQLEQVHGEFFSKYL
ncbi:TFIIF-interacting CTD phosphatase, including NLI-interacting factor, partial [Pseudoloma neurophilia]